ncbi:hypothetical protein [Sneathiella sp.]|jgi:hypothetical protein|uniref:hypothetical protein n=1 Tax=Sneathiella sp. TaxID=1964365 RepID=UPI0039E398F5
MINSLNSAQSVHNRYLEAAASPNSLVKADPAKGSDPSDQVTLSEPAQKAQKLLSEFPPLILDPDVHLKNAEGALKDLLAKYNIPPNTKVSISSDSKGQFTVSGDHPLLAEVETEINEGTAKELRNSLVGAHNGSIIQRIGAAAEMAMRGADQNPGMTDTYYDWVRSVASEAKGFGYSVEFDEGVITGSLINSLGERIAGDERLSLPIG